MTRSLVLLAATIISIGVGDVAAAQPRQFNPPRGHEQGQAPPQPPGQMQRGPDRRDVGPGRDDGRRDMGRPGPSASPYYYNNRWVGADEWRSHGPERDRWVQRYNQRRGRRDDDGASLIAGIIGFALGAAIVGSMEDADRARNGDRSYDGACARKYRSYDARSHTYLGFDGFRHYCQLP